MKSQFREETRYFQECTNVSTPYYPMFSLSSFKWPLTGGLKQKKISNFSFLKWSRSLTRGGPSQEGPNKFELEIFCILQNWTLR